MCIILTHCPDHSLAIGSNIRLRQSQDLRATAGKTLCTRRIARQNPCPAYVSGRRWNVTFASEFSGERCLKRPRGTRNTPAPKFLRREKCCPVADSFARTKSCHSRTYIYNTRAGKMCKFVIANLYNWHGGTTLAI